VARGGEPKHPKSCHDRALGLLAVRPRSRRELERRLLGARFDLDEVRDVLARLEAVGLIDDAEFARQYAEHRFGARRESARAVVNGLRAAGVSAELAQETAAAAPDDDEVRALDLARSRTVRLAGLDPAKAFGRLSSFLMRRGYGPDVARRAARDALQLNVDEA
jgi:regulatory protein